MLEGQKGVSRFSKFWRNNRKFQAGVFAESNSDGDWQLWIDGVSLSEPTRCFSLQAGTTAAASPPFLEQQRWQCAQDQNKEETWRFANVFPRSHVSGTSHSWKWFLETRDGEHVLRMMYIHQSFVHQATAICKEHRVWTWEAGANDAATRSACALLQVVKKCLGTSPEWKHQCVLKFHCVVDSYPCCSGGCARSLLPGRICIKFWVYNTRPYHTPGRGQLR
jgi:hypothetical protein